MPDQLFELTPNELRLLNVHRLNNIEQTREAAAFSGYCAGLAFALAWNGKLGSFNEFYHPPKEQQRREYTSEEYIARFKSWS